MLMPKRNKKSRPADKEVQRKLPSGIKLVHTLRGHAGPIGHIAWSPDGRMLASASDDSTIRFWHAETGERLRTLKGHDDGVRTVAFDPAGCTLASGGKDSTVKLWELANGKLIRTLTGHKGSVCSVAFDPTGSTLASSDGAGTIKLWEWASGKLIHELTGHSKVVWSVAFNPTGRTLASGSYDGTVKVWEPTSGKLIRTLKESHGIVWLVAFDPSGKTLFTGKEDGSVNLWEPATGKLLLRLEGHTGGVCRFDFSKVSPICATQASDENLIIWRQDTWEPVATLPQIPWSSLSTPTGGICLHPRIPRLASVGSQLSDLVAEKRNRLIHIYELDLAILLGQSAGVSVKYTSAKVVLVGDSGVGKTGLGWRLAHGEFKEHASTHGQQFWLLKELSQQRRDGAKCEAVLWDLAGQPDYRLIHALFLDDADLAIVLFDPTRDDNPLKGVEFWLKQLKVGTARAGHPPTVLIAARSDRGSPRLTQDELQVFCKQRGINAYLATSAKDGDGIQELIQQMKGMIPWDEKPATVTTETFKRIKDYMLDLKESPRRRRVILTPEELRQRLEKTDRKWRFDDAEMLTAVGHLANHGYVTRLKTSRGEPRILLAPELLNNLAASFVLEARRNQKGLGSLEEQRLLSRSYKFPELEKLSETESDILLDSAAVLFLEHTVCFRETDPLNGRAYLVFPELINLKKPLVDEDNPTEDSVAYTISGAVENVYASLVVLLGYTQTFTRTNQSQNQARYEVGDGQTCGFRQEDERPGELDFILYFGTDTPVPVRTLFQSLFENFLARRNLTVRRFEPVVCANGHLLNRAVVREQIAGGADSAFCNRCGAEIALPKADKPIQLTKQQGEAVEANRRAADQRSRFEQVLFRLKSYVTEEKIDPPECFISYAWGKSDKEKEHERWVEKSLATDLQKAGVKVLLDKWENRRIGSSIMRFVEQIEECKHLIVVGTPLYRKKAKNVASEKGSVVAAEWDLAGIRMMATEAQKQTVLPVLLAGEESDSFPALLRGRVYADFRKSEAYFDTVFEIVLSLYQIQPEQPVAIELRESLTGRKAY